MNLPFRARLYFMFAPGCSHCQAAEPHVDRFQVKNPVKVMVVKVNASRRDDLLGFKPRGTPAYLLVVGETKVWKHEGMLDAAELQAVFDEVEKRASGDNEDEVPKKKGRGKLAAAPNEEEE